MPNPDDHIHLPVGAEEVGSSATARFPRLVTGMGCSSLFMSLSTILLQAPTGVLFQQHAQLYYVVLLSLAAIATTQIGIGIFLQYGGAPVLERVVKTFILTASTLVLILTATIGGFCITTKI
jgi:hypothetical protein